MKLEKVVLNGFKSFADSTEFTFDSSITAIVGPNGCGKSNVVDAVKWVLGEQSVKSMRSGQMADVIFGGSSSRKPLGSAEVSLVFSNTSGKLSIDAQEVQISRRIYKSGESEYRINGKVSRLKQIKELFMDTGIGVKAYSIIEQGQVEKLLTASKTDRRAIFEEAAGVSKYKAQKNEAQRKLERTEQNLLRLADILNEVQKQLRSVKLQAGKARNYLTYTDRLKELQVNYSLVEYHKIKTQTTEKADALAKIQEKFAEISAQIAKNDAAMSELSEKIVDTENRINQADNALVSVQSKIEQNTQKIGFLNDRIDEIKTRKIEAGSRIEKLREQKSSFQIDIDRCKDQQQQCEQQLEEKTENIQQMQEKIQVLNQLCSELNAQLEDERSGIIDMVRRTSQLHNELQSISVHRDNLSNQKDRLSQRADTAKAELEKLLTEKAQNKARSEDIEKVLEELTANLEIKKEKLQQTKQLIEDDRKRLAEKKEDRSALSSELNVLTDMEQKRQGLTNAVKNILKKKSEQNIDYIEGILADIISAEVNYATAVEAALEGKTDAVVVNSMKKLLEDDQTIEKLDGRVVFLSTCKVEPFVDTADLSQFEGVIGRVVEFVSYDSKFAPLAWKLLGKTLIVDSIESAYRLADRLGSQYSFVTLKGQTLSFARAVKLGPLGKSTGLISRKSRMNQLKQKLDLITTEIADIQQQIENNNQTSIHLSKLCQDMRTSVYEANTEKMQSTTNLNVIEKNIQKLTAEQPLIAGEIGLLSEQIEQSVKKEYESKQKLEELEVVNNERNARIQQLEAQYLEQKEELQAHLAVLTDLKVALGQLTEQSKSFNRSIEHLENQILANNSAIDTAAEEIESSQRNIQEAQRSILSCEALVSELFVEKEAASNASRELHEEVAKLLAQQKETESVIRSGRSDQSQVDEKLNQLKIELSQLEVKEQNLTERVQEELQLDLAQSYQNYEQGSDGVDWQQVRQEITELRSKIERLGNVNVDAIDEQQALEERNEFLSKQVDDLNKSKTQLQQLITRLNKVSVEKFQQTFEEIRVNFQQLFRKLFGGGKADILMEESDDVLEAGIEVIARPPGKEMRSISLLSGGEKTMTAIAMLFSVFKSKPSPFCILDEVDAALDEANNERFNLLVKEFEESSQFIVITHSKRTMSMANILYGVTMQTRGVSKKISVRFGEVDDVIDDQSAAVA